MDWKEDNDFGVLGQDLNYKSLLLPRKENQSHYPKTPIHMSCLQEEYTKMLEEIYSLLKLVFNRLVMNIQLKYYS